MTSALPPIDDHDASPEVRAIYDDIRKTRDTDYVGIFWRVLANDPAGLKRTWEGLKQVMAPGMLDPLVKEMLYLAVSITNGCDYCSHSHGAAAKAKGMTPAMFAELMAIVGMANQTNKLADGYRVPVDERFKNLF
ncbi:MAG TPA: carboxymuconolactone decarboxylase family protein [Stellaceae bacterium]|jgi:AhpD family alkylhydroperoxidase|nr:carboxymuconolactone decarboxylase family protein [Stellaceae bacterium]